MPKRTDLKKILVIGSGPIVIGQAAEFDYAGTQACLALREEGYEVVLANSNPATIMTDSAVADKIYMEPLTLEYLSKILRYERPDAILPGIGGQTGLNLAMELERRGVLKECQVELLGTSSDLYAGQAVDRIGVKLGFGFPAGAEVSRLAAACSEEIRPKTSVRGLSCSLSGLENQCSALLAAGRSPEYVCKYCLLCIAHTVVKMTRAALAEHPGLPVVCAGGVMSSTVIRDYVTARLPQVRFVPGKFSSDNAIGVALLAAREVQAHG